MSVKAGSFQFSQRRNALAFWIGSAVVSIGVLLHLVGLAASGTLAATLDAAVQTGCAVRGAYGEGTSGTGHLFQV